MARRLQRAPLRSTHPAGKRDSMSTKQATTHLHPMRFPPRRSFGLATSALAVALTAITAGATAACGDADVGDSAAAILSIQGEADLSLPAGGAATLVVRYHDGLDQPLAGRVEFVVLGDGGALAAPTALATEDG